MERHRGQSLVELALVTPVLLLLILITADSARVFSAHLTIGNAAREGASFGSRSLDNAVDDALIEEAVHEESGAIFGQLPDVQSQLIEDAYGYDAVRVTVTYTFEPLFTVPGLPSQIELERAAQMRVLDV
jgi:Flp pilus assembly protein TadG